MELQTNLQSNTAPQDGKTFISLEQNQTIVSTRWTPHSAAKLNPRVTFVAQFFSNNHGLNSSCCANIRFLPWLQ